MKSQPIVNITTTDIKEWRDGIKRRLDSEPGFAAALESDTLTQCRVEEEWLDDPQLNALSACVMKPPVRPRCASSSVEGVFTNAIRVISAIDLVGTNESQDFRSFIKGESGLKEFLELKHPVGNTEASFVDLRHEAIVGFFGTNRVRRLIPNFKLVYAYVVCEGANTKTAKKAGVPASPRRRREVVTGRGKIVQTPVLVTERYGDATTLTEALKTLTPKDFFAIFMQVVYALKTASEEIEYTHYDLHASNIELYPCDECYIPYQRGGVYVAAKYVAVIANHGFAHFTTRNSDQRSVTFGFAAKGRSELVAIGIFRDRPNFMTDVYRLLATSAAAVINTERSELVDLIGKLVSYFNQSETIAEIVESQKENYYYLPLTPNSRALSFDDFLSHAKREMRTCFGDTRILTSTPKRGSDVILQSGVIGRGFKLISVSEASTSVFTPFVPPDSFLTFVDAYEAATESLDKSKEAFARLITVSFIKRFSEGKSKFDTACKNAATTLESHLSYLKQLLAGGVDYIPVSSDFGNFKTPAWHVSFTTSAKILDTYVAICEIINAAKHTIDIYWKTTPPPHITLKFAEIEKYQIPYASSVGVLARVIAEDCKTLFPEKFGLKVSKRLETFRGDAANLPIIRAFAALSLLATSATNKSIAAIASVKSASRRI